MHKIADEFGVGTGDGASGSRLMAYVLDRTQAISLRFTARRGAPRTSHSDMEVVFTLDYRAPRSIGPFWLPGVRAVLCTTRYRVEQQLSPEQLDTTPKQAADCRHACSTKRYAYNCGLAEWQHMHKQATSRRSRLSSAAGMRTARPSCPRPRVPRRFLPPCPQGAPGSLAVSVSMVA
jgi:hypothetical protein